MGWFQAVVLLRQVYFAVLAHNQRHLRGFDTPLPVGALDMVPYFNAVHQLAIGIAVFMVAAFPAGKYRFHTYSIALRHCYLYEVRAFFFCRLYSTR